MKILNGDIYLAREPLQKLLERRFPVKTSYALAKLAQKLGETIKIIEQVRLSLVQEYGEKTDTGQIRVEQGSKKWSSFIKEFDELLAQEVDIDFDMVVLPDCEIEPNILMLLDKFVEVQQE